MEVISKTLDFKLNNKTVIALGKFDGVHKGHLLILDKLWEYRIRGHHTAVVTFDTSPMAELTGKPSKVLTTSLEKELVMDAAGVETLVEFPFTSETAAISAEDFVKDILVDNMQAEIMVVGEDCSFGHKALGNAELLTELGKKYGFETIVIPKLKYEGEVISSTLLRELIAEGKAEKFAAMSRQPYFVYGNFQEKGGIGQKYGFPCCAIVVPEEKVMPRAGFYYSKVLFEDVFYPSCAYVDEETREIEIYLFEASREIGYQNVSVGLFKYIREPLAEEILNRESDELIDKIKREILVAKNWHREHIYVPEDVCYRQF